MGRGTLALSPAHRLYRLIVRLLAPAVLGWLWWRGRREPLYAKRLPERLGMIECPPEAGGGILIHAASAGEVQAARPLIEALRHQWRDHSLTVSTVTPTGMQMLRDHWGAVIRHVYLPLDTAGATARFLDRLQPRILILVEREVWPELLWQCRRRCIPVVIVNARLSERSARGYRRLASLFGPAWSHLSWVAAAEPESQARYIALGVPAERCHSTGNLKFDMPAHEAPSVRPPVFNGRLVVVAGSTHQDEEDILLSFWAELVRQDPRLLLVLVPRHPQRFDEVARRLDRAGLAFARHSRREQPTQAVHIWLGDTMGQLMQWYQSADLCFIGGSLANVGGHNALEAMVFGKPVLFGPYTHNFERLYQLIETAGAGARVTSDSALRQQIVNACQDLSAFRAMGQRAAALVRQHQGATARTLDLLALLWSQHDPSALAHIRVLRKGGQEIWWDPELSDEVAFSDFDLGPQTTGVQPMATGSGRGQVHLTERGHVAVVLRHYRRGGLVARISRDRFLGRRAAASRAMQEYQLLRLMRSWRLPVPAPVAARFDTNGLTYRADIMVALLPGTRNLVQRLAVARLPGEAWEAIGQAIRRMHERQVFHSDLNAHNLLLDDAGAAWIVDFDKCRIRCGDTWKPANLDRLLRSLRKESKRQAAGHWRDEDWNALLKGYAACESGPEPMY
jgi:3-deoxy-D-manno-octulosonic-acid transferase